MKLSGIDPPRWPIAVGASALVVVSVGNVLVRSGWMRTETGGLDWGQLVIASVLVLPALANILIGRRWNGWLWGAGVLLSLMSWVPFLGGSGDLSCTDCAFALLWPISLTLPLTVLLVVRTLVQRSSNQ